MQAGQTSKMNGKAILYNTENEDDVEEEAED